MEKQPLLQKLNALRKKQKQIDNAWSKTGNKQLIEFFIELIPKALDVERCSIFVYDPTDDDMWLQCGTGVCERAIKVPKWNSIVGKVVETGKPVVEYEMEDMVGAHDSETMRTGFVVRDTLCVPVKGVSINKITGAIQVLNKKGLDAEYSQNDLDTLEQLSYHMEMNIENIYLRQQLVKVSVQMSEKIAELELRLSASA